MVKVLKYFFLHKFCDLSKFGYIKILNQSQKFYIYFPQKFQCFADNFTNYLTIFLIKIKFTTCLLYKFWWS